MSTTSVKPVPTLKGIFSVPKRNHRRDFLRENKLNLRELQRVTTNKLKGNQDQQKQSKQQIPQQQQQQQQNVLANRRSASQARIPPQKQLTRSLSQQRPAEPKQNRQPSRCSSVCSVNNGQGDVVRRSSHMTVASKAISCDKQIQTEDINDEEFLYQALKRCTGSEANSHSSAKLNVNAGNQRQSQGDLNMPHRSSYHADGDDCQDECFQPKEQQNQLKQTSYYQQQQPHYQQQQLDSQQQQSNDQHQQFNYQQQQPNYHQQQSNFSQQQSNYHQQHNYEDQRDNYQQQYNTQTQQDCHAHQDTQRTRNSYHSNNNNIDVIDNEAFHNSARITTRPTQRSQHSQHSIRSQNSHQSQQSQHSLHSQHSIHSQHSLHSQHSQHSHMNGQQPAKSDVEDIGLNLDNLAIDFNQDEQHLVQQSNHQLPLSGRSRHTIGSSRSQELTKKKSNGSIHKLGSRDDVRLPKYLEREKREKEEQRMRDMVRDPNCPLGHFALTEDERLAALATAQKKFQSLVNELNHMPMTTQTLRIRTRKAEIEKELAILEADIRVFSKSKVYVKKPDETDN